jgi:hypothetical protein
MEHSICDFLSIAYFATSLSSLLKRKAAIEVNKIRANAPKPFREGEELSS